jgi:hypothetical protein
VSKFFQRVADAPPNSVANTYEFDEIRVKYGFFCQDHLKASVNFWCEKTISDDIYMIIDFFYQGFVTLRFLDSDEGGIPGSGSILTFSYDGTDGGYDFDSLMANLYSGSLNVESSIKFIEIPNILREILTQAIKMYGSIAGVGEDIYVTNWFRSKYSSNIFKDDLK